MIGFPVLVIATSPINRACEELADRSTALAKLMEVGEGLHSRRKAIVLAGIAAIADGESVQRTSDPGKRRQRRTCLKTFLRWQQRLFWFVDSRDTLKSSAKHGGGKAEVSASLRLLSNPPRRCLPTNPSRSLR
jgi:hypothetical protein